MKCEHKSFQVNAQVGRLSDIEGGPVTSYTTEIRVHCADCGLKFRWLGLPFGSSPFEPRLSADSLELRAPIEPAHVTEILGRPLVSGQA